MNTFGERLRFLRKSNNVSIKELAELLEVSTRMISFYETNEREPSISALKLLSERFNCTLDFLLGKEKNLDGESILTPILLDYVDGKKILDTSEGIPLPEHFAAGRECFLYQATDNSMEEFGIRETDFVIAASIFPSYKETDALVIYYRGSLLVRMISNQDGSAVLTAANIKFKPEIAKIDDIIILGKVIALFRTLKPEQ